jgi:hypothetical protein
VSQAFYVEWENFINTNFGALETARGQVQCKRRQAEAAMQQSERTSQSNGCDRAEECARTASRLAEATAQIQELVQANCRLRTELAQATLLWVDARSASRFDLVTARRQLESKRVSAHVSRTDMAER